MNAIAAATRVSWRFAHFGELTAREVHDLYQLRAAVFVLEQNCAFQDVDGADLDAWHLLGTSQGSLEAYARLLKPGVKFREASIGRVITSQAARGTGLGRALMGEAVRRAGELWPGQAIRIGAQARLERFYEGFGFRKASDEYIEDGIPHIEMLRP